MLHNAQTANTKIWQLEAEIGELQDMLDAEHAASDQTRDKLHEALRRKLILARELQRVEGWTGQQRLICAFLGVLEPISTSVAPVSIFCHRSSVMSMLTTSQGE